MVGTLRLGHETLRERVLTRFRKFGNVLRTLATRPSAISVVLTEAADRATRRRLTRLYGRGDGLPTVDLLDLFPALRVTVDPFAGLEGGSTVLDFVLLAALAEERAGGRYLEIGTWRGESVANVARFASECVTVSLPPERLREAGLSQEFVDAHQHFSRGLPNVKHVLHDSRTLDYASLGTFDLVFVDGDHSYEAVKIDTKNVFNALRDERSVIVWHDYGKSPERPRWEVLAGILDGCPEHARSRLRHVSNTLCAVYIPNLKVPTRSERFPRTPNKTFRIDVTARPG